MKKLFLLAAMSCLVMNAWSATPVKYIDANGVEQTCSTYSTLSNQTTMITWPAGWYVVKGNVTYGAGAAVSGDVHLILTDGCQFTVTGAKYAAGISVQDSGNSLTIYGQTNQTGQLIVQGGTNGAGIGGNYATSNSPITINGGYIEATGGTGGAGIGGGLNGKGKNITIRRATVIAKSGSEDVSAIGNGKNGSKDPKKPENFLIDTNLVIQYQIAVGEVSTQTKILANSGADLAEDLDGIDNLTIEPKMDYPIIVQGIQVNNSNYFNVLKQNFRYSYHTATVSYDPDTKTLTLLNAHITNTEGDALVVNDDITIKCIGTCVLESTTEGNAIYAGGHNVTIDGSIYNDRAALILKSNLSAAYFSNGNLTITGANVYTESAESYAMYLDGGQLSVDYAILSAQGNNQAATIATNGLNLNGLAILTGQTYDSNTHQFMNGSAEAMNDITIGQQQTPVTYVDSAGVTQSCSVYTIVKNNTTRHIWSEGWYVVQGSDVHLYEGAEATGNVHLILTDGSKLTSEVPENPECNYYAGICVSKSSPLKINNSLTIYGQAAQTGTLNATSEQQAGIGGQSFNSLSPGVNITINGGIVTAKGSWGCAGIGGEEIPEGIGDNITINGGHVTALGGAGAAGIGGGSHSGSRNIRIRGGKVTAIGGDAGIEGFGDGIGNGANHESSVVFGYDHSQDIYISTSCVVKADGDNPPTTIIANTGGDLAASLKGKRCVTIESGTTGMEQVTGDRLQVADGIHKILRGGQLLIIRDGHTYNAQGAIVE